jgi:hypothetical protein
MERISKEQLEAALAQLKQGSTETGSQLQRRLPQEELTALGILLERTARRYPNQDLSETLPEYLTDFEQLAIKHGLGEVEDAIVKLRTDPDFDYFPTPNEVARQIKTAKLRNVPSHIYARG